MKKVDRYRWVAVSVLGLALGLAAAGLGASAGDPVDPQGPVGGSGPGGETGGSSTPVPKWRVRRIENRFETSLHATRIGKKRFYSAFWDVDGDGELEDNGGFEHSVIDVYDIATADYEALACKTCHYPPAVAAGLTDKEYPGNCTDCHWNYDARDYGVPAYEVAYCDLNPDPAVVQIGVCPADYDPATRFSQDAVCLGCHSRQGVEHSLLTDVHRAIDAANPGEVPKFNCMGCHKEQEVHGDTLVLESHLDAPKVSCAQSGCHKRELRLTDSSMRPGGACRGEDGKLNRRCVTFHKEHLEEVDCTACHVQSNTSCNSCHFDSELKRNKRFYQQIPAQGFNFLMNFEDIQTGEPKVRSASYQSLTVGAVCSDGVCDTGNAQTFVVFAPYAAHSVTKAEELECLDCHVRRTGKGQFEGNPAVIQYLTEGTVTTTTWNPETKMLEGPTGIIPVPHDWAPGEGGALEMDFVYYLGNPTDPVTKNPAGDQWAFLKTGPDRGHMPYGTPLSREQIEKLILEDEEDD